MKAILLAIAIVALAVVGWSWYRSEDDGASLRGSIYDGAAHSNLDNGPDMYDGSEEGPGIFASGSIQGDVR